MRLFGSVVCCLLMTSTAYALEMQARKEPKAVAAPTQPIVTRSLEAPALDKDEQHIQAIVNREPEEIALPAAEVRLITNKTAPIQAPTPQMELAPVAAKLATAVVAAPKVQPLANDVTVIAPIENESTAHTLWMQARVFAIRWFEFLVVALLVVSTLSTLLLYRAFCKQNLLLARSLRLVEDTVRTAQRMSQQTPPAPLVVEARHEPRVDTRTEGRVVKMKRPADNQPTLDLL
jgi:hypothetical protein